MDEPGQGLVTADMVVDDIVTRFPATIRVFTRRQMHCYGCEMAQFETLEEVCRAYGQPLDEVLADLRRVALRRGARKRGDWRTGREQ